MAPVAEEQNTFLSLINKKARTLRLKAALEVSFCANLLTGVDRQRLKNIGGGFQVGEIAGQVMLYIRKERIVFNIPFMPRQEKLQATNK
ncbi:hypothetical protein FORC58_1593 [Salmonella enterica subsp. enterica serovar Typhimurium]|nr:hypothetical protein FORC58_1593 [Salmonella enterica subsp. enterica serovar Typhimurium]